MTFPIIDPVAFSIGPFAIRWYALAYIGGLILGWRYCVFWAKAGPVTIDKKRLEDFLSWAVIGIILGGRFGYVFFYNADYYLSNPLAILEVWKGGMSFHGGLLGMIAAVYLFARKNALPFLALADLIAAAGPIGLFLGRIANFINGELWGRLAPGLPWGVRFPDAGDELRHPSQLYEAGLEGVVLFIILLSAIRSRAVRSRPGIVSGIFLVGYAMARIIVEYFREPDTQIGFIGAFTMGQILSLPMLLLGLYVIQRSASRSPS